MGKMDNIEVLSKLYEEIFYFYNVSRCVFISVLFVY